MSIEESLQQFKQFVSLLSERQTQKFLQEKDEKYHSMVSYVTEKIHGSNFSVYVTPKGVTYASRSQVLPKTEKRSFMDYRNIFTPTVEKKLIRQMQRLSAADDHTKVLRFIGEIFPTQREIDYGNEKQFRVFHIQAYHNNGGPNDGKSGGCRWLDLKWSRIFELCAQFEFEIVPSVATGPFKELYETIDCAFDSKILNKPNNMCEGVCFRVEMDDDDDDDDVVYDNDVTPKVLFFKKRNEVYFEQVVDKCRHEQDHEVLKKIKSFCTRQRVINVTSKYNFTNRNEDYQKLMSLVIEDAKKDILDEDIGVSDDDVKLYLSNMKFILQPFVKEIWTSIWT